MGSVSLILPGNHSISWNGFTKRTEFHWFSYLGATPFRETVSWNGLSFTGFPMQDPGPWTQDPGSRTLDPGCSIQDPGSRTPDLGYSRMQDPGSRIPDPGSWIPDPGTPGYEWIHEVQNLSGYLGNRLHPGRDTRSWPGYYQLDNVLVAALTGYRDKGRAVWFVFMWMGAHVWFVFMWMGAIFSS